MTEMYEKSLGTLELGSVLSMLASEAVSSAAKERALELRPTSGRYELERRLSETTAAKNMYGVNGTPGFSDIRDVKGSLGRAALGGMLNTRELLDIAEVLRSARTVGAYISKRRDGSSIDYLFQALRANKQLEERITTSIIGDDELADSASSELASIRRHIRVTNSRIRETLQKITSSSYYAKYLQEPIITLRSDRYVVPVKAEYKSAIPGLVHDISASGATLFIEPMQCVNANNELRELAAQEKQEIERILRELSAEAASCSDDILSDFNLLTTLDLIFAKAKLSFRLNCSEPELDEKKGIILRRARHPLLDQSKAVPIDIRLGSSYDTLVITGPNTGGKTVTLKTIGLLCLMAQCGLHIPVDDGSNVPIFEQVLADIGDEQSIEQSLSTFSSHMRNIVRILDEASGACLILFDELGAGTDPVEGAALAIAIIEHARQQGATIAATTHYAELKIYATTNDGVQNASCEFDVETLKPTYRLLIGIPGKSNAFAISQRLGLKQEIIEYARSQVDTENVEFEQVLEQLEHQRQEMERESIETKKLLLSAQQADKAARENKAQIDKERDKAAQRARHEAQQILDEARRTADKVFDELNEMKRQAAKMKVELETKAESSSNENRAELMRSLNEAEERIGEKKPAEEFKGPQRPVKIGDRVEIVSVGAKGDVTEVRDGVLTIVAGVMRLTAKEKDVRIIDGESKTSGADKIIKSAERQLRSLDAKAEIDIRGMMRDEAVAVATQFLDNAVLARLNTVSIIHGKGTGALRAAIHDMLKHSSYVKSYRLGKYGEGESGVTIVELK